MRQVIGLPPSDLDDYLEWQQRLESQEGSGLSVEPKPKAKKTEPSKAFANNPEAKGSAVSQKSTEQRHTPNPVLFELNLGDSVYASPDIAILR